VTSSFFLLPRQQPAEAQHRKSKYYLVTRSKRHEMKKMKSVYGYSFYFAQKERMKEMRPAIFALCPRALSLA